MQVETHGRCTPPRKPNKLGLQMKKFKRRSRPLLMHRLNSSRYGRSRRAIPPGVSVPPRTRKQPAKSNGHGTTKDSRRKGSTAQNPLNESTPSANGGAPDETIPVSTTLTISEQATTPVRKRSGSISLESDVPPKRLKLGPLKGWGIEKDGVNMSAVEYAQKRLKMNTRKC
ncbi:hypothetical protein DFH07DRAFT_763516 [Mycena maculata]|uniref:Uncharacterized protein n=1 Tax=Mycena maculata TaxID=230809 RepID=A0AAD7KG24_9AGAR|nr:hypothetical protein DFH07DRAFT_763516 [Mycena maculata]